MSEPVVFISYKHESPEHKKWVRDFASDLRAMGIDVTLDQWDLAFGQDVAAFMANGVSKADRVILICTEAYVAAANEGSGGVGYERLVVTQELVQTIETKKFVPVVRANSSAQLPAFLGPRLYVDMRDESQYDARLQELMRALHGVPEHAKPPLGPSPFSGVPPIDGPPVRSIDSTGATPRATDVLDDRWFVEQALRANEGMAALELQGAMELRFGLHRPVNKSQVELLRAMKNAEITTFGWPIGVVLENSPDFRPKAATDGIVAEVPIQNSVMSGRTSYDYWRLRNSGDFYLLQSLFEDQRSEGKIFFDSRVVRVTESLMFCARLYEHLGVDPVTDVTVRVSHQELAGRSLVSASPLRHVRPAETSEAASQSQFTSSLADLREHLVERVLEIVEPLFMLFDFKQFDRNILIKIATDFTEGKV